MDSRTRSTVGQRIYDDFIPQHRLVQQGRTETLVIELQGFRKEQVKVQIDKYGMLKINGERPLMDNRWSRFHKEYQVPENCSASAVRAKFENGLLKISLPKLVTSAKGEDAGKVTAPPPPPEDDKPKAEQELTSQKTISRTTDDGKQHGVKDGEPTDEQKGEEDKKGTTADAEEKQQVSTAVHEDGGLKDKDGINGSESYWRRQAMLRTSVAVLVLLGVMFYASYKLRNAFYTYGKLEV